MSTRATPAFSLIGSRLLSSAGHQLVVGLGTALAEREPRVLPRARESPRVEVGRDPRGPRARGGALEHRPVGPEHVGAADVGRVAVEADLVGEGGKDRVVACEGVVEARWAG